MAVSAHLEVHRTRAHRAAQVRVLADALRDETRPVILAGDFNSHTFDRGLWHAPLAGALALLLTPGGALRRRLLHPDEGPAREPLFDELRDAGFEWAPFVDHEPTLQLRFDRLDELHALFGPAHGLARRLLRPGRAARAPAARLVRGPRLARRPRVHRAGPRRPRARRATTRRSWRSSGCSA